MRKKKENRKKRRKRKIKEKKVDSQLGKTINNNK